MQMTGFSNLPDAVKRQIMEHIPPGQQLARMRQANTSIYRDTTQPFLQRIAKLLPVLKGEYLSCDHNDIGYMISISTDWRDMHVLPHKHVDLDEQRRNDRRAVPRRVWGRIQSTSSGWLIYAYDDYNEMNDEYTLKYKVCHEPSERTVVLDEQGVLRFLAAGIASAIPYIAFVMPHPRHGIQTFIDYEPPAYAPTQTFWQGIL